MGFVGFPGQAGRYVSGLCVATLGLCAAGWRWPRPGSAASSLRWPAGWVVWPERKYGDTRLEMAQLEQTG